MEDTRPNYLNYDANLTLSPARAINGNIVTLDWIQSLIARGFGWHTQVGTLITPIVGGGNGTVIIIGRPELLISIPAGQCMLPYRVNVQCQCPLLATDADKVEISITADTTQKWDGTGTFTSKVPTNARTDIGGACPAQAASSFSAAVTQTIVMSNDYARTLLTGDVQGTPATAIWTRPELIWEPKNPPIIMGPAMLVIHYGGTVAVNGYVQAEFLMLPSTLFQNLI
jgi:hypothetical protein